MPSAGQVPTGAADQNLFRQPLVTVPSSPLEDSVASPLGDPVISDHEADSPVELLSVLETGYLDIESNPSGFDDEPLFGPPEVYDRAVGILRQQLGFPAEVASRLRPSLD